MKTLEVLAECIRLGLTNNEIVFLPNGSLCTFETLIGKDYITNGKYKLGDVVPSGLFIYTSVEEGYLYIGVPDNIFESQNNDTKIAFYEL